MINSLDVNFRKVSTELKKFSSLKIIKCTDIGLHFARHAGLSVATGEIVSYLDDDAFVNPSWFEAIYQSFQEPDVHLVGGDCLPLFEHDPPAWLEDLWTANKNKKYNVFYPLSLFSMREKVFQKVDPCFIFGCNFSIRKSTLLEAGGFHPDAMPDDLLAMRGDGETHVSNFVKSYGLSAMYHPEASISHYVSGGRMSYSYFYRRGFSQGISISYMKLRNDSVSSQNLPLAVSFFQKANFLVQEAVSYYFLSGGAKHAVKLLKKGTTDGMDYHLEEYKNRDEIKEWVHRENYLR